MSAGAVDSSKPSVAFLIDRWDPERGGAERAMAQFAEHLLARGYRVLAVACEHAARAPGEPVRVSTFGITRSQRERRLAKNLVAAARTHGADVTVGCRHLYACDLYWPHGGAHAITLAQMRRARGLAFDGPPHGRHRTFIELERELCERGGARKIACVSRMVIDELSVEWPACRDRLVLVENGVDLTRFHPDERERAGASFRRDLGVGPDTVLMGAAMANPSLKGVEALHVALVAVDASNFGPWHLLFAGGHGSFDASFSARHVTEREWVDPVALWSAADLCVQPTWRDTSGLSILEALACGTPVVTTRLAGASAVVLPHAGCVIDRPDDQTALRGGMTLWMERARAGSVDRAAIRRCVEHLDISKTHAKLEALVVELAGTAR